MKYKDKQRTVVTRAASLRGRATREELHIKLLLDNLNISYMFQKGFISQGNYCIVDFYLPSPRKICLEIDGLYHNTPEQQARDDNRTTYLEQVRGFKVLRISNADAMLMTADDLLRFIDNTLIDAEDSIFVVWEALHNITKEEDT